MSMENNISDFIRKYNIKLIMPTNADSWNCEWKDCAACCITEKTIYHIKNKCSEYNPRTKECNIYNNRLVDCKIYPFMIIPTKDGVNLTPSLNCPYILSSVKMNELLINEVLKEKEVRKFIENYNNIHRETLSILNIKNNIDMNNIKQINDLLNQLTCFKYLEDLKNFILKYKDFDPIKFIKEYPVYGSYIQPNYSINRVPNPLVMNLRLTNKKHIIFKNQINTKIIKEIIIPDTIAIDDSAQTVLKQYIELNINRQLEFHSLYVYRIQNLSNHNINFENAYLEVMISVLIYLYIHLILLILRENIGIIDYPIMREALSMTDSQLNGVINAFPNNPIYGSPMNGINYIR